MRSLIIVLLLVSSFFGCRPGKPFGAFKIIGTANVDAGKVVLLPVANLKLYPEDLHTLETRIDNGKFEFSGIVPSPMAFSVIIDDMYMSGEVIVSAGSGQHLRIDLAQLRDSLESLDELSGNQRAMLYEILEQSYRRHDSTLLSYVRRYPNSFVGFWKLAQLTNYGYEPIFEDIFRSFDLGIANSYPGQRLCELLSDAQKRSVGSPMPAIYAVDAESNSLPRDYFQKHRYTLLEFWYSSCGPCIAQFPDLKTLYDTYAPKGFHVIGISTDRTEHIEEWKSTVEEHHLPWPQYLCENGAQAGQLGIVAYPSSFLVDGDGKIILINVRPLALAKFLQNNL